MGAFNNNSEDVGESMVVCGNNSEDVGESMVVCGKRKVAMPLGHSAHSNTKKAKHQRTQAGSLHQSDGYCSSNSFLLGALSFTEAQRDALI